MSCLFKFPRLENHYDDVAMKDDQVRLADTEQTNHQSTCLHGSAGPLSSRSSPFLFTFFSDLLGR